MTTLWPTLTVADADASLTFYAGTLGFKSELRLQDNEGDAAIIAEGRRASAGAA